MARYEELVQAWNRRGYEFQEFEEDCRNVIERLRLAFVNYWGISGNDLKWLRFNSSTEEVTHPLAGFSHDNKLFLSEEKKAYNFAFLVPISAGG